MKRIIIIANLLLSLVVFAQPGSIDLSFNPSGTTGANDNIRTMSIQNDGKIIIGGDFTTYNGISINRIARLNADLTLDTSFNPGTGANFTVETTSIQSDGKIIIGGFFSTYNGIIRKSIARLNSDGELDLTFDPGTGVNNSLNSTAIQSDGKIIIGGAFSDYNGTARNNIARLNIDGTVDDSFNMGIGANGTVTEIAIQIDSRIIISGSFTTYDNLSRNRIARLNSDGTIDFTFFPGGGPLGVINSITTLTNGKLIIAGDFTSYAGVARKYIARLNVDGSADNSFTTGTGPNAEVSTTASLDNGNIIIVGNFTSYNGNITKRIAKISANGSFDPTFNSGTGVDNSVYAMSIQSSGNIIIGGAFTLYNNIQNNRIARLNADGTGNLFNSSANDRVYCTATQNDGKIVIGGTFTSYNGVDRITIARLNVDGTLDTSFDTGTGTQTPFGPGVINAIAIQNDGKIIIGGDISYYNGIAKKTIVRLNSDGTLDNTFNQITTNNNGVTGGEVKNIYIQTDGKIIIVGSSFFPYRGIARLNVDGSFDTSFMANVANGSDGVFTAAIQSDGKIIIAGGFFGGWNGNTNIKRIARLNIDGSLDNSFNTGTGANFDIYTCAIESNGKIIIGGNFTTFNGVSCGRIARLNSNGSFDNAYNIGLGFANSTSIRVWSLSLQDNGKLIVGGQFSSYNGVSSGNLCRLNIDGTLDTSLATTNSIIYTTSIQSDGKIVIGGLFTSFGVYGLNNIARINGDNALSNITNVLNKGRIVIYPNPSNGIYTLQTNEMNAAKSISIYTILGQKIHDAAISSNETTIDISNQPKGVYLYKILGEKGEVKSGKLVIE
jgi:uncharacterized delta-60 repeat protein